MYISTERWHSPWRQSICSAMGTETRSRIQCDNISHRALWEHIGDVPNWDWGSQGRVPGRNSGWTQSWKTGNDYILAK